ncbi:transcriptional regulator GlxA family with amidase domain [Kitasatospora kifunensis]|uniref:Transcriptional regulator GlxA family with amidase domain n=1 Tax=Kitasatospora kifunensis TaxID=58351 RepID=A0A7W7R5E0_KITKI|nr:transcriptional regulator GlxA family with amidase domain [Kitasatospora kifunensis]
MASGLGSESNEGGGLSGYPVSSGLGSGLGSPAGPTGLGGSGSLGPVGLGGPAALGGSGLGGSGLSGSGLGAGSLGSSGSGGSPGLGAGGGQGGPAISVAPRKLAGRRRRETVAVLIFSGAPIFESSIPLSVFGVDRQDAGVPRYRLLVCAGEDGPLTTTGGVTLTAPFGLEALARAGTIVVPAWRSISQPPPVEAIAALRKAHHEGARIIGLCTGAFVLAAAGLLDGRPATTHWMYAPTLAKRYPRVHVDPRELFVDDGDVLTSAGTAAGIDLCLHVVRSDHGAEAANALARRLVVPNRRSGGGQAQYIDQSLPEEIGNDPLAEVVTWALENLNQQFDVEVLAARAYMSRRTFDRRFRTLTGSAPLQWLITQRVLQAQRLLETSELSVDDVARRCGFRSPVALRGHFRRQLGVSPAAYRTSYRARRPGPGPVAGVPPQGGSAERVGDRAVERTVGVTSGPGNPAAGSGFGGATGAVGAPGLGGLGGVAGVAGSTAAGSSAGGFTGAAAAGLGASTPGGGAASSASGAAAGQPVGGAGTTAEGGPSQGSAGAGGSRGIGAKGTAGGASRSGPSGSAANGSAANGRALPPGALPPPGKNRIRPLVPPQPGPATRRGPAGSPRPVEHAVAEDGHSQPSARGAGTGHRTERPTADRRSTERPAVERSATERPAVERPSTDRLSTDRLSAERPVAERPGRRTDGRVTGSSGATGGAGLLGGGTRASGGRDTADRAERTGLSGSQQAAGRRGDGSGASTGGPRGGGYGAPGTTARPGGAPVGDAAGRAEQRAAVQLGTHPVAAPATAPPSPVDVADLAGAADATDAVDTTADTTAEA